MRFARFATLVILLAALAACGPRQHQRQNGARGPAKMAPVQSSGPRGANFSDAHPVAFDGRGPRSYGVHGIDISRYQTEIDWPLAQANGVSFAFIKATEGGDIVDPMFASHWQGAAQAGVARGAYHFYYHCRSPEEQARYFIRNVPRARGALPPVLDMEWTPFSPTCTKRENPRVIRQNAATFMNIVAEHYGQVPIMYTTVDFFTENELWRLSGHDFWLRSVAQVPAARFGGQHWTFWQYTGTGLVPGVRGKTDINVFAGNAREWSDWRVSRQN